MKIAIQGHLDRGKEVIQILESLGGRNTFNYNGDYIRTAYFIGMDYSIYGFCTDSPKVGFKVYTLEEFEKEFPFKIGDKVIYDYTPNFVGTVVNIKFDDNIPYRVNINGTICTCGTNMLKLCKEMNEERNITLTLDKAKEWYKKGGELREIALQAFTEKELTKIDLPKTWEEFCENYPVQSGECWLGSCDEIYKKTYDKERIYKNWIPSKKSAEAHLAMIQLEQLRNCWLNGWEPIWDCSEKWCIRLWGNELGVGVATHIARFLTFPTNEMAREFLECFRDLIEKAKDLI